MSVPKEKLHELIDKLSDNETPKVLDFLENLKKKQGEKTKPSDFRGVWKNKNLDVEKICKELRDEWDRDIL